MAWQVVFLDQGVRAAVDALPVDIRAKFLRITQLIQAEGIQWLREPYVKHLEGPVWEMRMKGRDGIATAAYVTASDAASEWTKDPAFRMEYDALEAEFALAAALIKARGDADMTQEQVAAAMGTTQAAVARMESGRALPSTRTLERFARATRTRLRISFEPAPARQEASR
jgi:DNA-binding XRE family transcriptional regulator